MSDFLVIPVVLIIICSIAIIFLWFKPSKKLEDNTSIDLQTYRDVIVNKSIVMSEWDRLCKDILERNSSITEIFTRHSQSKKKLGSIRFDVIVNDSTYTTRLVRNIFTEELAKYRYQCQIINCYRATEKNFVIYIRPYRTHTYAGSI